MCFIVFIFVHILDKSFLTYRHKIRSLTGLFHGSLMLYFVSVFVLQDRKLNQVRVL